MSFRGIPTPGWVAISATALAGIYGGWLLIWALSAPSSVIDGTPSQLAMIYGQPLLAAGAAWATLHRYCTTGSAKAGVLAAVMAPLYLGWTVLAGFSVAAGGMPAAVLLLVAAWLTPRGPLMSTTP